MGGGSSSSSAASTTHNIDKRLVNSGGVGVSADNSNVTVNALDGGAVTSALDFAKSTNAANSGNYDKLLQGTGQALTGIFDLANKALSGGFGSLAQSQTQAQATIDTAQSKGTLDNRTITIVVDAANNPGINPLQPARSWLGGTLYNLTHSKANGGIW